MVLLIILILPFLIHTCDCSYTKVQYISIYSQVTGIINCRISSNAVYTTADGNLHLWTAYQTINSYSIPAHTAMQLECSKYANHFDHVYLATLDNNGKITLWQEIIKMLSSYLSHISFTPKNEKSQPTDISIGSIYLAIGYKDERIIDIYDLNSLNSEPITITIDNNWKYMKMDSQGNLALLTIQDGNEIIFQYHIFSYKPSYTVKLTQKTQIKVEENAIIDYEYSDWSVDRNLLSFLISGTKTTGIIHYRQNISLSQYISMGPSFFGIQRLCDGERTSIVNKSIEKASSGTIISLDFPVSKFACTTDTGTYLQSQFYVVSLGDGVTYIDCFYAANAFVDFIVGLCFCCCCICLRVCVKAPESFSGVCKWFGSGLYFLYFLFCWCPTQKNVQEIQDALQI